MIRFLRYARDHYLVVPLGAIIAVIWANTWGENYFRFSHALAFAVNQVGMALFFALVTQEIAETTMHGGALHTWKRAIVPVIGAVGGMAGATLLYLWYLELDQVGEVMLQQAWPVASAVDIAFSYFVAKVLFRDRVAIAFTLMIAIASDVIILPLVAITYPFAKVHEWAWPLIALPILAGFVLRRKGVWNTWPFLACGVVSWWGFFWSGIHPALALVPIVPFVAHSARNLELFGDELEGPHRRGRHLERILEYPVQVVLFLFALVNAGLTFEEFEPGTWAVPLASIVGRSIGLLSAVALALALGLRLPQRFGWRELVVVTFLASTGFTFALFVATVVLPYGSLLTQARMGALTTVIGSALAVAAGYALGVGRFSSAPPPDVPEKRRVGSSRH